MTAGGENQAAGSVCTPPHAPSVAHIAYAAGVIHDGEKDGRAAALCVAGDEPEAVAAAARRRGWRAEVCGDPYAAMVRLVRRPRAYTALVLALDSAREGDLKLLQVAGRRFPGLGRYVCRGGDRPALLATARRLGAEVLEDAGDAADRPDPPARAARVPELLPLPDAADDGPALTADELKALLADGP